jgi:hypothetical protein
MVTVPSSSALNSVLDCLTLGIHLQKKHVCSLSFFSPACDLADVKHRTDMQFSCMLVAGCNGSYAVSKYVLKYK